MKDNSNNRKNKKVIIIIFIILGVIILGIAGFFAYQRLKPVQLAKNHVFVCDNPSNLSDFDKWLKEDMKIKWTPTYVVIKNGKIIGAFNGDIPVSQFREQLGTVLALNQEYGTFQGYELTNLDNETTPDYVLFNNERVKILEISWIDCEDCQHQDENYTELIYRTYGVDNFYRYYIKSEKPKVLDKYITK